MRLALVLACLALACSGEGVSNDPGRLAACSECSSSEYCLIVSGTADTSYCAAADCGTDCDCIIDDAKSRLEVCQVLYSCQAGAGIMYCFEQ